MSLPPRRRIAERIWPIIIVVLTAVSTASVAAQKHTDIQFTGSSVALKSMQCSVSGEVVDLNGYLVPGVKIIFSGDNKTSTVEADYKGKYKIALPHGTYDIQLKRGVGLARYKRARYKVSCSDSNVLNLVQLPECVSYGCIDTGYSFQSLPLGWIKNKDLDAVIAYETKKSSRTDILYNDAILTYNGYTIFGNRITQKTNLKTLIVEGPAWIDDGTSKREVKSMRIEFDSTGALLAEF